MSVQLFGEDRFIKANYLIKQLRQTQASGRWLTEICRRV